jgi:predicted permease
MEDRVAGLCGTMSNVSEAIARLLADTARDVRHAARLLALTPGFTAVAVLSLALGIGSSTAVFSVVDAALLNPLPYEDPARLMAIHGTSSTTTSNPVSYPNYRDWRDRVRTFEAIAAWRIEMFTLSGPERAERVIGGRVSANYFAVLRVPPLVGRTFTPAEDARGGPPVAILGERLWRRRFAGDPGVVGGTVILDGTPHAVVGVMPARVGVGVIPRLFDDVFLPIGQYDDPLFLSRHVTGTDVIGRLGPGIDRTAARAELAAISDALAAAYPESNRGVGANVVPLSAALVGDLQITLTLLLAAAAVVLLIACANVNGLMLARFTARSQEFAVRASLGATRIRIVRQALTEGLCLASLGGMLGVPIAVWGPDVALSVMPSALPDLVDVDVNPRVLLVAAVTVLATGLLCAAAPAHRASGLLLTAGLRTARGVQRPLARQALLAAEVALMVVLLAGAGLMAKSLDNLWRVDPGFDPGDVVTFMTGLPADRAADPERVRTTLGQIAERLATVPGVEAAATVFGAVPYTGNNNAVDFWRAGDARPEGSDARLALFSAVGPEYFRVMRIPLRRGRAFTTFDAAGSPPVAIVDEGFARGVFAGEDAIGQRMHLDAFDEPVEVVGVVGRVSHWGLDGGDPTRARIQVYVPNAQLADALTPLAARQMSVVVRASRSAPGMIDALRTALGTFDGEQVMIFEGWMAEGVARSLAPRRFSLALLGAFSLMALVLAAVGIHGLAWFVVTERTREIGVRKALGAQGRDIVQALLHPIGRAVALGVVLGLPIAVAMARVFAGTLFGVSSADPATLAGVCGLTSCVALAAVCHPARRMLRVDPVVALRHD